ncbi:PQQ-binding-like beta-propeller repeat protein [Methyloglobulus sp.]|uniref:outer membrane protein assembly factor BamB family protein n=1 Tax=Methyloglobulus sp. TaxID=2518622 RepID=UPI0032B7E808
MKLSGVIKCLSLTGSIMFCSGSLLASDQWAMHQANSAHTGYIPATINVSDITFRWKKKLSSAPLSPLTAANGLIFVADPGYFGIQHLYALRKNGTLAWGKAYANIFSVNPPSYADGIVYVQTGNSSPGTFLRAFSAVNGNVVFQSPHAAQWEHYLSPTIYNGTVYINGGSYGGMYSFAGITGHQNWFYSGLPQVDGWTPAVDDKWAYSSIEGILYVVDRLTGKPVFKIDSGNGANPVPMLGGANDVFVLDGGMITKFNTITRKIAWQKIYNFGEDFTGQPALANGVIYAGTNLGRLVAISQTTGNILWSWKNVANDSVQNNIVITKSHAFLGTANKVFCIDLKTHQSVWSYAASGYLALAESGLYVGSQDGTLTAFKLGVADLFAPSHSNFGPIVALTTKSIAVGIKNVGDKSLSVNDIVSDSSIFSVETAPTSFILAPGEAKLINVSFTPSATGVFKGNLKIHSDDQNEPELIVKLQGRGI